MFYVRTNQTLSGATSVQVVSYLRRKRIIEAHIGSAKDESEILELKKSAQSWIDCANKNQLSLFPELMGGDEDKNSHSSLISIDKCQYLGFRYQLLYDVLWSLSIKFKFHLISESKILNDLVISRIAFPSSKLEAFEFIGDFFGIKHHRTTFYRQLASGNLIKWQEEALARILKVAKKYFGFNFSLVFYDLTTLYFTREFFIF